MAIFWFNFQKIKKFVCREILYFIHLSQFICFHLCNLIQYNKNQRSVCKGLRNQNYIRCPVYFALNMSKLVIQISKSIGKIPLLLQIICSQQLLITSPQWRWGMSPRVGVVGLLLINFIYYSREEKLRLHFIFSMDILTCQTTKQLMCMGRGL